MLIKSEAQRLAHPQARLIPRDIMSHYFFNVLPGALIPFMKPQTEEQLDTSLRGYALPNSELEQIKLWLAIALSHPNLSPIKLLELAKHIGLSPNDQVEGCLVLNRKDYFAYISAQADYAERIKSSATDFFKVAAQYGNLEVLRYLEDKGPDKFQEMIAADNFYAFRGSAQNGHLEVLRYLEDKAPAKFQEMIAAGNLYAFSWAAESGYLEVLRYLEDKAPDKLQEMIATDNFAAFRWAAQNGHLEVLRYLEDKAPDDKFQEMIATENFYAFSCAALNGNLAVLRYLEDKAPAKLLEMIAAANFAAFRWAAANGHLEVLRYLEDKAPAKLQEMIAAFRWAAQNGHLEVLRYLEDKAPDKFQEMIAAFDFAAFGCAAQNGQLEVLRYLEDNALAKLQEMIAADNFYAFRGAAASGHLEVLRYLEDKAPAKLQEMIAATDFYAFRWASRNTHHDVCHHLLNFACVFAYAESHQQEYAALIQESITEKLAELRTRKERFEQTHPNVVFDADSDEEKDLWFYYARFLIRRNEANLRDELVLLLSIPGVKMRAHRSVRGGVPNELLRLALSVNNAIAAQVLLALPEVRREAAANDYYRGEQANGLDLSQLARDRESSMTALTQGEQRRLNQVEARYQSRLQAQGITPCMKALREALESRYKTRPATITLNSTAEVLSLPLHWPDFKALKLAEPDYSNALKAYYQHKAHSAWRYLSKPNPWMHEHSSYVYISDNRQDRWSTFEEYQPLIALLYLAANDTEIPDVNGYTHQTRLEHFIAELALIGRAHNWDKTRIIRHEAGQPLLNANEVEIKEEYDDLEGDRPSCYSGVKRRLFQSVQGHPDFAFLTKDKVVLELNGFVRAYFKNAITKANSASLKAAWDKRIIGDELSKDDWTVLKSINLSKSKQHELNALLIQKYGESFSHDPSLNLVIQNAFALSTTKDDAHVLNFGHLNLEPFFNPPLQHAGATGFFTTSGSTHAQTTPNIQSDPISWGDYLLNLLKYLINAMVIAVTCGYRSNLFELKVSNPQNATASALATS